MTTLTIGRRLVPLEQIAFVEPFDPAANPKIQTDKAFKSRIVLLDRESVLSELETEIFASDHGFRWIMSDQTATNPAIHFSVEHFEPAPEFTPRKPYRSRLVWRDLDGNTQSKLLTAEPATLLAVAVRGDAETDQASQPPSPPARRGRQTRRRQMASSPA